MADTDEPGDLNPFTFMLEQALDSMLRQAMFTLPGRVMAFDPETQLASVECGVQRVVSGKGRTIPVVENVPVHFPGDNGWYFFHQITPEKTEGLIHFSQRAIDTWIDQGGPVAPHDLRLLSEKDAFFVPGVRSQPNKIPDLPTDGAGVSSYDGSTRLHLRESGDVTVLAGNSVAVGTESDELLAMVSELLQALIDSYTATSIGNQPLSEVPAFTDIKSRLDAITGAL